MSEILAYFSSYFVSFSLASGFFLSAVLFGLLIAYGFMYAWRSTKTRIERKPLPMKDLRFRGARRKRFQ